VDSHSIAAQCPDGVQSIEELLTTVPKETFGICYTFSGKVTQQLSDSQALFGHRLVKPGAHTATVVEFEKGRVPDGSFQGIVKGYKVYKNVAKDGGTSVVPLLKSIMAKRSK